MSKLENGRQNPSQEDIRCWTEVTGDPAETDSLIAALRNLESQYGEWQRQLRAGMEPHQQELAALNARTQRFRVFETTVVPGLLQTAGYAHHRFAESIKVFRVSNDLNQAVHARIQRQDILYDPDKRFHFIITEAALRYRLCPAETMLTQLDRLVSASTMPNLRLGIIALDAPYVVAPAHGFWILDEDRVMVETFSAELNLAQPEEISLYASIFETLAYAASYGRDARKILHAVAQELAEHVDPHGQA